MIILLSLMVIALVTPDVSRNKMIKTNLGANKSLLLKVLYEVNPKCFLECFVKKI